MGRHAAIALLFVALVLLAVMAFRKASAHEPYSQWRQPDTRTHPKTRKADRQGAGHDSHAVLLLRPQRCIFAPAVKP